MAKDHPVGNTNNEARGRGIKDGTAIRQRIPDSVRKQIEPKDDSKKK